MKDTGLQWYWAAAISVAMAVTFVIDPSWVRLAGLGGSLLFSFGMYLCWLLASDSDKDREFASEEASAHRLERDFARRHEEKQKAASPPPAPLRGSVDQVWAFDAKRLDQIAVDVTSLEDDVEKLKLALNIRQIQAQPTTQGGSGHLKS